MNTETTEQPQSTILTIQAGNDGIDSKDWVRMLREMYGKWAAKNGYKVTIWTASGLTGRKLNGPLSYIEMEISAPTSEFKSEVGVHRMVRASPFDEQHRRTTVFATVSVREKTEDKIEPDLTRSYIFAPYTMAKDYRTGVSTADVEAVLDGDLSIFASPNPTDH